MSRFWVHSQESCSKHDVSRWHLDVIIPKSFRSINKACHSGGSAHLCGKYVSLPPPSSSWEKHFKVVLTIVQPSHAPLIVFYKDLGPHKLIPVVRLLLLCIQCLMNYPLVPTHISLELCMHHNGLIPIPNKDHADPNSYRPIALTSCLCKIIERMINTRFIWYLEKSGILDRGQCGFRKHCSTMDHLVSLEICPGCLCTETTGSWSLLRPGEGLLINLAVWYHQRHAQDRPQRLIACLCSRVSSRPPNSSQNRHHNSTQKKVSQLVVYWLLHALG